MKRTVRFVWLCLFLTLLAGNARAAGERLFYMSGGQVLQGVLFKPKGKGPFPAVIFNQNSVKTSDDQDMLRVPMASVFNAKGYVLFLPGRHKSAAEIAGTDADATDSDQDELKLAEAYVRDIATAMMTLKAQSCVDPNRIVVMGTGVGGSATLLLAAQNLDVRGYVAFSPAVGVWKQNESIRAALTSAVEKCDAPIFLIQARNDPTLGPTDTLGKLLDTKGKPNQSRIYPPYGKTPREARTFAFKAPNIWGSDVLAFVQQIAK